MMRAMKGVTKSLTKLNAKISLPGLQKVMTDFMRENEKSDWALVYKLKFLELLLR